MHSDRNNCETNYTGLTATPYILRIINKILHNTENGGQRLKISLLT